VPQGRHVHGLLARGSQILEELLPGLLADLVASGIPVTQDLSANRYWIGGRLLCHDSYPLTFATYQASRPHLERHLRDRLRCIAQRRDR